jgi:hypothetical protein
MEEESTIRIGIPPGITSTWARNPQKGWLLKLKINLILP